MAEYRSIKTNIWRDEWFMELPADEKLLFIYLITNEATNLAGIYKINLKFVHFETGLPIEFIVTTLLKFESAGKATYRHPYIWITNLRKYNCSDNSQKALRAVEIILDDIPECEIKQLYMAYYPPRIPYTYPNDTLPTTQYNSVQLHNNSYKEVEEGAPRPKIFDWYESQIGVITPMIADELKQAELDYSPDWIEAAFREAARSGARSWRYIDTVLKRWQVLGHIDLSGNSKQKGGKNGQTGTVTVDDSLIKFLRQDN